MPTTLAACGIETPSDLPGIDLRDEEARRGRKAIFGTTHSIHNMVPEDPDATLQYQWCIEGKMEAAAAPPRARYHEIQNRS